MADIIRVKGKVSQTSIDNIQLKGRELLYDGDESVYIGTTTGEDAAKDKKKLYGKQLTDLKGADSELQENLDAETLRAKTAEGEAKTAAITTANSYTDGKIKKLTDGPTPVMNAKHVVDTEGNPITTDASKILRVVNGRLGESTVNIGSQTVPTYVSSGKVTPCKGYLHGVAFQLDFSTQAIAGGYAGCRNFASSGEFNWGGLGCGNFVAAVQGNMANVGSGVYSVCCTYEVAITAGKATYSAYGAIEWDSSAKTFKLELNELLSSEGTRLWWEYTGDHLELSKTLYRWTAPKSAIQTSHLSIPVNGTAVVPVQTKQIAWATV